MFDIPAIRATGSLLAGVGSELSSLAGSGGQFSDFRTVVIRQRCFVQFCRSNRGDTDRSLVMARASGNQRYGVCWDF